MERVFKMNEKKKYSKPTAKLFDIRMEEKIAATCFSYIGREHNYSGCEDRISVTENCRIELEQGS